MVVKPKNEILESALNKYFSLFDDTRRLVFEFIARREHSAEILILLCARLDALASDAAKDGTPSRRAFTSFITAYGGQRDIFNSVSIADLYYELAFHRWLLEGMIPAPGRLHIFSRNQEPIVQLLEDAGLPITLSESKILFDTLLRLCKQEYRAVPGQRLTKPRIVSPSIFQDLIVKRSRETRIKKIADNLPKALSPLLETKKIGNILYRRFRSDAIHGATVILDSKRFLSETEIYWKPLQSDYYGPFELIEFPATFLLSLLDNCITTYRANLTAKGKVPPSIHFYAFSDDVFRSLDLFDHDLLAEGGRVRFRMDR